MSAMPESVREGLAEVRAFLDEIELVYPAAVEAQWEQSPVTRGPRAERVSGGQSKSDPTAVAVLDERRLALRAEVKRVERFVVLALRAARAIQGKPVRPMYRRLAA